MSVGTAKRLSAGSSVASLLSIMTLKPTHYSVAAPTHFAYRSGDSSLTNDANIFAVEAFSPRLECMLRACHLCFSSS